MSEGITSCDEIENHLPLHAGGDLEPENERAVEAHLAECPACSARFAQARSARAAFRAGLSESLPRTPDLWLGVRETLIEQGQLAARPALVGRGRLLGFSLAASLAAAAALAGFWLGGSWTREKLTPSSTLDVANGTPATDSLEIVAAGADAATAATPVSTSGLRRLRPGEPRLRDRAQVYVDVPWNGLPLGPDPSWAPVSLEQPRRGP